MMTTASTGRITTHVLDTSRGIPADGVPIALYALTWDVDREIRTKIAESMTNLDGRLDTPLIGNGELSKGIYEIQFNVESYYAQRPLGEMAQSLWGVVPIRFTVLDATSHYHIPLLIAPGGYSTYRGS
ncbi:5-hydroxyisourate hydrolase [Paenibacillus amylolyticus]|uniref:5-hydroxyisourate hydrolase n=1 Tax=Paenibacillus amylolyticus TaxID=1451 RepID=A0AAP5H0X5_PAEAM|nr:hydroxyisourate hydrolase [Paenibacillus amylolyticus]MDR6724283.1 5-hydroxyisourate hydrolase [Paenibacillus amylolyticus]